MRLFSERDEHNYSGNFEKGQLKVIQKSLVLVQLPFLVILTSCASPHHKRTRADRDELIGLLLLDMGRANWEWADLDIDRNGKHDVWTRDVAGLFYFYHDGKHAMMINYGVASADPNVYKWDSLESIPVDGYLFSVLMKDENGIPYSQNILTTSGESNISNTGYKGTPCLNDNKFAYIAYPQVLNNESNIMYIMNHESVVYRKAMRPTVLKQWPGKDPEKLGWTRIMIK